MDNSTTEALWSKPHIIQWSQLLLDSYAHWLRQDLIPRKGDPMAQAQALFSVPFVVVSHGIQSDPILNYGNQTTLTLWEMSWEKLTQTPSRLTAESVHQDERQRMLAGLSQQGFIDDYQGIRISSSGKRFRVQDAIVWNIVDNLGQNHGQAATFSNWQFLGEAE